MFYLQLFRRFRYVSADEDKLSVQEQESRILQEERSGSILFFSFQGTW